MDRNNRNVPRSMFSTEFQTYFSLKLPAAFLPSKITSAFLFFLWVAQFSITDLLSLHWKPGIPQLPKNEFLMINFDVQSQSFFPNDCLVLHRQGVK